MARAMAGLGVGVPGYSVGLCRGLRAFARRAAMLDRAPPITGQSWCPSKRIETVAGAAASGGNCGGRTLRIWSSLSCSPGPCGFGAVGADAVGAAAPMLFASLAAGAAAAGAAGAGVDDPPADTAESPPPPAISTAEASPGVATVDPAGAEAVGAGAGVTAALLSAGALLLPELADMGSADGAAAGAA